MTPPEDEQSGFLSRWSRRKQAVKAAQERETRAANPSQAASPMPVRVAAPAGDTPAPAALTPAPLSPAATTLAESTQPPSAPPFDLASLPDISTLTGESNMAAFMHQHVPEALRQAALRKVWAQDAVLSQPFGPLDYAWDFNDPASLPHGFGPMEANFDTAAMARKIFGESEPETDPKTDHAALPEGGPESETDPTQPLSPAPASPLDTPRLSEPAPVPSAPQPLAAGFSSPCLKVEATPNRGPPATVSRLGPEAPPPEPTPSVSALGNPEPPDPDPAPPFRAHGGALPR